jgi:type I restriction enzyme S subunit
MIGKIPVGWSIKTVADICDKLQYGLTASANSSSDIGPKFLRITDITQSGVNWDKVPYCECQIDQIEKFRLFNNDILFARIGGTTGKSFIVKNPPQSVFASYLIRLRVLSGKDNPNYLYFYFQSPFYWQQINANKDNNLKGGVNASVLSELQIISPPLKEQQKIAAVLFKIQQAIEVQESIIEATQELKKSTMQHAFTYGLRGEKTKETEIGRMPESWEIKKFGGFATLHRGYDLPVQNRKEGKVPIVGSNGICGYHNQSKIKGPGVVTGRSGSIGMSYYINDDYWPLNTGLYVENFHNNDPLYSHYFFQSFNFKKYASGVSVPTLNRNLVHAAVIGVPLIKEQNDIVSVFKTIDDKIEIHSTIKSALQDMFKTMLNNLMTGEIRVNSLDINVIEVVKG